MMQNIRCFYHSGDFDGVASAAIVLRKYPDAILHPVDYGQDFDAKIFSVVEPDDIVIMVDFSLKPIKKLVKLSKKCKTFIWIDHHGGIISEAKAIGFEPLGIRIDGTAACVLTWKYFFDMEAVPVGIDLIGKWDIHDLQNEDTVNYHFGIDFYDLDPTLSIWKMIFENDAKTFEKMINNGILLHEYDKRSKIEKAKSYGFDVNFGDYSALAINGYVSLDDIVDAGIFDSSRHDFLVMFVRVADVWRFSLRSNRNDVDVNEIAKRFKGGGHKLAAGFETKDDSFITKMIKGKVVIKRNKE